MPNLILPNSRESKSIVCPYCKNQWAVSRIGGGSGWQPVSRARFESSTAAPWSSSQANTPDYVGVDYVKRSPVREPSLQGDVFVPAAQSVLTGLAVGVPLSAGMGLLGYELGQCLTAGALAGLVGVSGTWFFKLGLHNNLLWLVETVSGRDIDGDDQTGKPEPDPEPVKLEVTTERKPGQYSGINLDLPEGVTMGLFAAWAQQVTNGIKTPSRANWTGRGKPFSRKQYDDFLKALTSAGIIRDIGDGGGRQLTNGGKRALARMLQNTAGRQAAAGNAHQNDGLPTFEGEGGSRE